MFEVNTGFCGAVVAQYRAMQIQYGLELGSLDPGCWVSFHGFILNFNFKEGQEGK
jgi:hypothetical protein